MAKGAKKDAIVEGNDPVVLLRNYQHICRAIGTKIEPSVVAIINGENDEKAGSPEQFCVDADLGPAGVRALTEAFIGGVDKNGASTAYKIVNTLRLWRCGAMDEGACAVANLLLKYGSDTKLQFVQLLDNQIGPRGCGALGDALSIGCNKTLLNLQLDHNDTIGSEGVKTLCKGLRSNSTIKKLGLSFCGIGPEGGVPLQNLLKYSQSSLIELNVHGNRLAGPGLSAISKAFPKNKSLAKLYFGDNAIGPDVECLKDFAENLKGNKTIKFIEFEHNGIEEVGAQALVQSGAFSKSANHSLEHFTIDTDISEEAFNHLLRVGSGGKKKKGKGKKGKK